MKVLTSNKTAAVIFILSMLQAFLSAGQWLPVVSRITCEMVIQTLLYIMVIGTGNILRFSANNIIVVESRLIPYSQMSVYLSRCLCTLCHDFDIPIAVFGRKYYFNVNIDFFYFSSAAADDYLVVPFDFLSREANNLMQNKPSNMAIPAGPGVFRMTDEKNGTSGIVNPAMEAESHRL